MAISWILSLGAALVLSLAGCRLVGVPGGKEPRPGDSLQLSATTVAQLRIDLARYVDNFSASVAATADTIAAGTKDRRVRELTLLWKLRMIPPIQRLVLADDPRYAFLDIWALTAQMRAGFEKGAVSFDTQQHLAIETASKLESEIEVVAAQLLSSDQLAEAKKEMQMFAEGHAVSNSFSTQVAKASQATESTFGHLTGVLSIPISGLSDSAQAIERLSQVAGVFTEVIQDMPERTRWQTELLLLQIEDVLPLGSALRDWGEATESFKTVAATVQTLPEDLRKELEVLIDSTDKKQAELQNSLQELTTAAKAVNAVLATIQELSGDETPREGQPQKIAGEEESSFDINEYTQAAESIRAGAVEVRSLLEEIESGKLSNTVSAIGGTADSAIDHGANRTEALIDRITYRALLVIGAFFSAFLLYRLLARRLTPPASIPRLGGPSDTATSRGRSLLE